METPPPEQLCLEQLSLEESEQSKKPEPPEKLQSEQSIPLSLDQLPSDILDLILDELPWPKERTPLASVNKKLHAVLQPIIFKTVVLQWGTDTAPRQIARLLRSLKDNPQLRSLVKTINLIPCSPWFEHCPNGKIPIDDDMGTAVDKWFDELGGAKEIMIDALGSFEKDTGAFRTLAKEGATRTIMPLLCTILPNLERLYLTGHIAAHQDLLWSFIISSLENAATSKSDDWENGRFPFANLKHVKLMLDYHWGHNDVTMGVAASFLSFFYLPLVESMCIHAVYETPQEWPWPFKYDPNPDRLRQLQVEAYHNDGCGIVKMMVKVCSALETFIWTQLWSEDDPDGFSLTEMSSVLQAVPESARFHHLVLQLARSSGKMGSLFGAFLVDITRPDKFVTGTLNLAPLLNVTRMSLTWVHLFGLAENSEVKPGPSTFPPNLEMLSLHATKLITQEHLFWRLFNKVRVARDFAGGCRTYAPRLRECDFGFGVFLKHLLEDRIKRDLVYAGESQGVKVTFHSDCFAPPKLFPPARGDDTDLPHDWEWLVPDSDIEEYEEELEVDEVD